MRPATKRAFLALAAALGAASITVCPGGGDDGYLPVGPENDAWLLRMKAEAGLILGAWGIHGDFDLNRTLAVLKTFPDLSCLGITANGHPRHPLRLSAALQPQPFSGAKIYLPHNDTHSQAALL